VQIKHLQSALSAHKLPIKTVLLFIPQLDLSSSKEDHTVTPNDTQYLL